MKWYVKSEQSVLSHESNKNLNNKQTKWYFLGTIPHLASIKQSSINYNLEDKTARKKNKKRERESQKLRVVWNQNLLKRGLAFAFLVSKCRRTY